MEEQIENVKKILREENIKNIYLMFSDFSGRLLSKLVRAEEIIRNTHVSWFNGISLNGKLIEDLKEEKNSDWLVLLPDPYSFRKLTFLEDDEQKSAMIFCNIKNSNIDFRGILNKAVEEYLNLDITPMMGTQSIYKIETENEKQDFYQTLATNTNTIFNNQVVDYLMKAKIEIEYYMPYGKSHQRIDLVPDIANNAADKLNTVKWFIQNLGIQKSKKISFKNIEEPYLSTCPVHISLWKGTHEKNLFFDEHNEYELSELGEKFIKGILKNQDFIQKAVRATSLEPVGEYVNKYSTKRDNSILYVPLYFKEKQKKDRIGWSKRCIYNGMNADNNFYLVFSLILYAGLYGILDIKENSESYFKKKIGEEIVNKINERSEV